MLLADDSQIISLSEISTDTLSSAMAAEASKYRQNNSGAEEVYLLQPDIVLAGIYTAKATINMLESLNIRVEKFEPANTVEQIIINLQRTGELLGHTDRAKLLIANFESTLAELTSGIKDKPRAALYYTPTIAIFMILLKFILNERQIANDSSTNITVYLSFNALGHFPVRFFHHCYANNFFKMWGIAC